MFEYLGREILTLNVNDKAAIKERERENNIQIKPDNKQTQISVL